MLKESRKMVSEITKLSRRVKTLTNAKARAAERVNYWKQERNALAEQIRDTRNFVKGLKAQKSTSSSF